MAGGWQAALCHCAPAPGRGCSAWRSQRHVLRSGRRRQQRGKQAVHRSAAPTCLGIPIILDHKVPQRGQHQLRGCYDLLPLRLLLLALPLAVLRCGRGVCGGRSRGQLILCRRNSVSLVLTWRQALHAPWPSGTAAGFSAAPWVLPPPPRSALRPRVPAAAACAASRCSGGGRPQSCAACRRS